MDWTATLVDQLTFLWQHQVRARLDGLTDDEYLREPAPVTTIAWRLGHVIVGVFGSRNAKHFGGPPTDYESTVWPADAASAPARLDEVYADWVRGAGSLDEARPGRPVGASEGRFADFPNAALVLHINREAIHHLAEVALLRDLDAARP